MKWWVMYAGSWLQCSLRRGYLAACWLGLLVLILLGAWISVPFECCFVVRLRLLWQSDSSSRKVLLSVVKCNTNPLHLQERKKEKKREERKKERKKREERKKDYIYLHISSGGGGGEYSLYCLGSIYSRSSGIFLCRSVYNMAACPGFF